MSFRTIMCWVLSIVFHLYERITRVEGDGMLIWNFVDAQLFRLFLDKRVTTSLLRDAGNQPFSSKANHDSKNTSQVVTSPSLPSHNHRMSSKPPPPEEDAREWLLFDIEDQDPITADFLKPPPQTATPVSPPFNPLTRGIDWPTVPFVPG